MITYCSWSEWRCDLLLQLWSDLCAFCPPGCVPQGLQYVYFSKGLRGAAVLHPEETVLAEWPALWGPPLPRHRRLPFLPGQQNRTCSLEETSGKLVSGVRDGCCLLTLIRPLIVYQYSTSKGFPSVWGKKASGAVLECCQLWISCRPKKQTLFVGSMRLGTIQSVPHLPHQSELGSAAAPSITLWQML